MIGKGERLTLTGYKDVLSVQLEKLWPYGKSIERAITWEALSCAVLDLLPHTIGAMRQQLLGAEPREGGA